MTRIVKYLVRYGKSTDMNEALVRLEMEIDAALMDGWILQGGIAHVVLRGEFHHNPSTHIFSQALVFPDPVPDEHDTPGDSGAPVDNNPATV